MTDTVEQTPVETTAPETDQTAAPAPADVIAEAVGDQGNRFDFVLDKYRAEGRSDEESAFEQAKAYKELQSKFGSFTGAPEEYDVKLSDELSEKFDLEQFADDPVLQQAKEMAKSWGMNNEGFNQMVDLYFKGQMADEEAAAQIREQEMKALGSNAERRLSNLKDWASANLDSETSAALLDSMTSAAAVQAIEAVIAKTRNVPQAVDTPAAPAVSHDQLKEMLTAKDEYGNLKMSDPAYKAKVNKMYEQLYGAEPHRVTIGAR